MVRDLRYAQMAVRIGCAIVFLWFAVSAFMQPAYWAEVTMSGSVERTVKSVGMSPSDIAILTGIVEALIAAGLLTGFFMRWFTVIGAALLVVLSLVHGFDDRTVYHVGLIGALVALTIWPERHYA